MSIQIFGTKKCQNTRKTERYFKERGIDYQFVDLNVRGLSQGELNKVKQVIALENLIDKEGKEYAKRNLKYLIHDVEEMLLNVPLLFKTPIVRNKNQVTVAYCPETWKSWTF